MHNIHSITVAASVLLTFLLSLVQPFVFVPGPLGHGSCANFVVDMPHRSTNRACAHSFLSSRRINGRLTSDGSSRKNSYGPLDLTNSKFQKIKDDLEELKLFSFAIKKLLATLNVSTEREILAILDARVDDQLARLRLHNEEAETGNGQAARIYKTADFTYTKFEQIKDDLEELQIFQSSLRAHMKASPKQKRESFILLDTVVEYRMEMMSRKLAPKVDLEKAKSFVDKLMTTEIESIVGDTDMGVLKDIPGLETEGSRNIILRNITEKFWQACIDKVDTPDVQYRVCAVGTPGIGKTMTTAVLIRMLLKRGETVVYHPRTLEVSCWMYEFILKDSIVTVLLHPETARDTLEILKDRRTYYIVDPGNSKTNCNPPPWFRAKTIIVTSPDSRVWGGTSFKKIYGKVAGFVLVYPLWNEQELLQAREFFDVILTPEEVKSRYDRYGGVPRSVFVRPNEYGIPEELQELALKQLSPDQAQGLFDGRVKFVETMNSDQPLSGLIGYKVRRGNFSDYHAVIVSRQARDGIYQSHIRALWRTMLSLGRPDGWFIFESYVCALLAPRPDPEKPDSKISRKQLTSRLCVGKKDPSYETELQISLGGCTGMILTQNISQAVINGEANILYRSCNPQYPLFDFIYKNSSGHVFAIQATIGETHTLNVGELILLENQVGGGDKLTFCILVPDTVFATFVTVPVDPNKDRERGCHVYHAMVPNPGKE